MGWWGCGVYEGDGPCDVLCGIEDLILGHSIYDNADGSDATEDEISANRVKYDAGLLQPPNVSKLFTTSEDEMDDDSFIWYQVVGAEVMRVGGPLGEHKSTVLQSIADDDWDDPERIKCMAEFKEKVEKYIDGVPSPIGQNSGLFEKILSTLEQTPSISPT